MALIACRECSKDYSDEAVACVHCGAKNLAYKKPMGTVAKLVLGAVALVVAFLAFGAYLGAQDPTSGERSRERDVIAYCEDQYRQLKDDPRTSAGALGTAYGACQKMKDDYRSKWNRKP